MNMWDLVPAFVRGYQQSRYLVLKEHVVSSHLVDTSRGHGSIVEAQEGADQFQALVPVAPPPQVQGVVAPDHQV